MSCDQIHRTGCAGRKNNSLEGETVAKSAREGLAATRAQALLHGDVRARNIIVTPQGRVFFVSFSLRSPSSNRAGCEPSSADWSGCRWPTGLMSL